MSRPGPQPESEAQPGLATAELRREHEIILRALTVLERAGRRLVAGRSIDETALKDLIALLRTLGDQCHHGKEEGYLYPSMKEKGIPPDGPIARLLAEHSEVRDYLGTLSGLPSRAERAAAALLYVRVMRQHIEQENTVIFPVADRLFTPEEQATLARCYREMEARTFGAGFGESVLAELARIEQAIPG
ncbi:MAG: hemerythrin domain-containing protein [Candidatus Rokubacteria bacterium]|nr:hemerythrin domain-containing protein [Candidatus Rokubacteria bacterium]